MKTLPAGFGAVNMGRRSDRVMQPRFGLGTAFDDTRLDKELMDAFIPLLESRGGHLEHDKGQGDCFDGRADANPDGTITVHAEQFSKGKDGVPRKSVFEAVVDRDGSPLRLKIAEEVNTVHDEATLLPVEEREIDETKPHPLEGIQRLLNNPPVALNAVIHAIDRAMQEMLPEPLN